MIKESHERKNIITLKGHESHEKKVNKNVAREKKSHERKNIIASKEHERNYNFLK